MPAPSRVVTHTKSADTMKVPVEHAPVMRKAASGGADELSRAVIQRLADAIRGLKEREQEREQRDKEWARWSAERDRRLQQLAIRVRQLEKSDKMTDELFALQEIGDDQRDVQLVALDACLRRLEVSAPEEPQGGCAFVGEPPVVSSSPIRVAASPEAPPSPAPAHPPTPVPVTPTPHAASPSPAPTTLVPATQTDSVARVTRSSAARTQQSAAMPAAAPTSTTPRAVPSAACPTPARRSAHRARTPTPPAEEEAVPAAEEGEEEVEEKKDEWEELLHGI